MYLRQLCSFREKLVFTVLFLFYINAYTTMSYWINIRLVDQQKDINLLLYATIITCIGVIGAIIFNIVSRLFRGTNLTKSLKIIIQFFCILLSFVLGIVFFWFLKTWQSFLMISILIWYGALVAQFVSILIIETVEEMEPNIVIKIIKEKNKLDN
ncbi:hypothetical protein [Heyndrickxia ginsengihumi]|uniref:hypothetical protein n=1 Tax=Heyndrickxia ginsengihumi TaxID=363870 RepID=UPI0020415C9A|nr:hypothetical protein [Heyndrickxia ginsengihumi]MCM3025114.1 hypothetical protein [Heyndrickxia ginsengihumi]